MATNLLTSEEKTISEDKPQNLLPSFVGLKEELDETVNPERASNLFTKAEVSAGKYDMSLEDSVAYEETKSKSDFLGAATTLYDGLRLRLKDEVIARTFTLFQGGQNGASVVDQDWADKIIQKATTDSEAFSAAVFKRYGESRILPGVPIKITDVAALPSNMAYSVVSMGVGAAVGVPIAAIPLPGARVAAWTLGTVASGKAAYEMTTYQIMQTYLEAANDQSIKDTGKGITLEEENELKGIFNFEAMKYGLWEAVPEALSNLAFAKILTVPLTKIVGKGVAGKIIAKLTGIYGEELLTETITQKGQAEIERRAGLREGGELSWGQALKEIAPQTFLLTTFMAGAGSSMVAIKNKTTAALERELNRKTFTLDQKKIAREELEKGIEILAKERDLVEGVIKKRAIESTTGESQTYSEEELAILGIIDERAAERARLEAAEGVGDAIEPGVEVTPPVTPKKGIVAPKVVYHGTPAQFETFDKKFIGKSEAVDAKLGVFFVSDKDIAQAYGEIEGTKGYVKEAIVDTSNFKVVDLLDKSEKAQKYYTDNIDPLVEKIERLEEKISKETDEGDIEILDNQLERASNDLLTAQEKFMDITREINKEGKKAKKEGYKGIVIKNAYISPTDDIRKISDVTVAFDVEQIQTQPTQAGEQPTKAGVGVTVYRAQESKRKEGLPAKHIAYDKETAAKYGEVTELILSEDAKIVKASSKEGQVIMNLWGKVDNEAIKAKAKELGIDALDYELPGYGIAVFNEAILKEPTKPTKPPAVTPAERLARLEEREAERKRLQEELKIVEKESAEARTDIEIAKEMRGEIAEGVAGERMFVRDDEGYMTGEWEQIPSTFPAYFQKKGYTKKETLALLDKVIEGKELTEKQQAIFQNLLEGKKLDPEGPEVYYTEKIAELQSRIEDLRPEKITRQDITVLRQKIADIGRGLREGKRDALKEAKQMQAELIRILKMSDMEAKDKAKFIATIKNIQTEAQFLKALPGIDARIAKLLEAAEKRDVSAKIKKELKTTKPLKVGQRRVGKFDYETNKMFDTLRDYNKLNQTDAQAEFDKFPEEVETEVDLIKKRFLSLKANGAFASAEIHRQVLADIKRIKELGKKAKDEADLEKMLNRQERVDAALSSIDKISGSKKTIMGKITNAYRKGFSNIYSMLNSIGGKAFAEAYNPELNESDRNVATYAKTLTMTKAAVKIYNEKNVLKIFETMSRKDYKITDVKDGLTTDRSKLEIIDIYNSIKNEKKKADYSEAFGEDQVQSLLTNLTPQDEAFADSMQESVQEYREILNKRNIETTGRDLGDVENYWPATSEHTVSVIDDMRVQGETPSAAKERAKSPVIPIPKNAWYKAQRHIAQAEHVANISREYEALKRLFTDRKVKHAVTEKYGEDVYNTVMAQIDNISLNKQTERIDAVSKTFQKAINNWVTAKIALNPSTFVRQLMSVGNYAENMNPAEWTVGFFKGIAHPKATFDFVWNNDPSLEARFNKGYNEALAEALEGAKTISVNRHNWTKFLTSLVRSGDITAIVYGGHPLIKSELAKHGDMKKAINVFRQATLRSQQSGLASSVSQFQNSRNPFTRLFLAFKNTSNQYFRKMADAVISYQNGDISLEQFAKTMTIYAVIQPILYVSAGYATKIAFGALGSLVGLRDDDEDFEELLEKFIDDVMVQLIVSPVNSIPLINDAVRAAGRKATGQKVYQFLSIPWLDDLERAGRAMLKTEVTGSDYLKMMSAILEPTTALPVGSGIRYYEILTGKKISGQKKSGKKLIR